MNRASNNNSRSIAATNQLLNRITNSYIHSDSINQAPASPMSVGDNNEQSLTWVDSLTKLDRLFSGSLLRLSYNLIDIVLLSFGLYYGTRTCSNANAFSIISICILIFSGLILSSTLAYVVRNWTFRHMSLTDGASASRYTQGYRLRGLFYFLRFVCICVGTGFVFAAKAPVNKDCEILRFWLGVVCFNTWVLIFLWPPKPSLPVRRSIILECFILLFTIIFYSFYVGFVIFATIKTKKPECTYNRIEDLYFRAPLKSFAYVGLILAGCIVSSNIINAILNQLYHRVRSSRRVCVYLSAFHYGMAYSITVMLVYYYSIGAVLLFKPRAGDTCHIVAPNLYRTLFIWELIQVFWPVIIWPLALIVCCLGVICGACLALCLPATITVPLLEMIRERLPNAPATAPANPTASPGAIDAIPLVFFGQDADEFNQTECAICRVDFEASEEIKRLQCGHLFHASCVSTWLSITRICPVCRRSVTSQNV